MSTGEYIVATGILALLTVLAAGIFHTESLNAEVKIHCLQQGNPALGCAQIGKR